MANAEVYPGPGVNTYKSTKFDVQIFSGTLYTSAYVYSATMPAWSQLSSHDYGFQLDYSTPPIMSWVNFGASAPVSVKVSGIGGYQITSVAIFPTKRNIPYSLTNNVVSCSMNTYDQYWLELNGNRENPLFLFANPFKPAIGGSPVNFNATAHGNIYFSAGVHDISAVTGRWQYPLNDNDRVYIEPGSWIKGGLSAGNSSGISIVGYGTFSQENINPTSINRSYPNILSACMVLGSEGAGYAGFDSYPPTQSRNIIDGPTFTMQSAYGVHFGNTIRNCKLIAPWYYNTDAFAPTPDCLAGSGGLVDHCFAFVGDDVFYAGLHNGYYGGVGDVSTLNCFVGTTGNSIFASYYPNPGIEVYRNWYGNPALQDTSALFQDIHIKTYQGSGPDTPDTGMYIGGVNLSSIYPTDQTHTNLNSILHFHMYLSATNYGTDASGWANRNMLFKNVHVEGEHKASLIDIQNRYDAFSYPPSYRGERCGTTSGIRFENVTFTTSGGIRKGSLIGLNTTNRPHHIDFNNVRIANTLLTSGNVSSYFYTNEFIHDINFRGDQIATNNGNFIYIPGRGYLQKNLPFGSLPIYNRNSEFILVSALDTTGNMVSSYSSILPTPGLQSPLDGLMYAPSSNYSIANSAAGDYFNEYTVSNLISNSKVVLKHARRGGLVTQFNMDPSNSGTSYDILRRVDLGQSFAPNERIYENFNTANEIIHNPTMGGAALFGTNQRDLTPSPVLFLSSNSSTIAHAATIPFQFDPNGSVEGAHYNHGGTSSSPVLFWRHKQYERVEPQVSSLRYIHKITHWFYQPVGWNSTPLVAQAVGGAYFNDIFNSACVYDLSTQIMTTIPTLTPSANVYNVQLEIHHASSIFTGDFTSSVSSYCRSGYIACIFSGTNNQAVALITKLIPYNDADGNGNRHPNLATMTAQFDRTTFPSPGVDSNTGYICLFSARGITRSSGWIGHVYYMYAGPANECITYARNLYTGGYLDTNPDSSVIPSSIVSGTIWPPG